MSAKILIAEDEPPQRRALVALLEELWPEAELVAECGDGVEAQAALERVHPDVLLLDLHMPGARGLEVAEYAAEEAQERGAPPPLLVFVTAHDEAAVAAFERGAVDYVLKPVRRERLVVTVARAKERLAARALADATSGAARRPSATPSAAPSAASRPMPNVMPSAAPVAAPVAAPSAAPLAELLQALRRELAAAAPAPTAPRPLQWVTATVRDTVRLYAIDEILAFQAQDKYTRALTATDEALLRTSLRELAQSLDPEVFWQVHRSAIVRATAIEKITRDELGKSWLTLKGRGEVLPVASAFHSKLRGM